MKTVQLTSDEIEIFKEFLLNKITATKEAWQKCSEEKWPWNTPEKIAASIKNLEATFAKL